MADHAVLIKEMVENEKLSSQKRLELARKRRQQQLKKYYEVEKKIEKQTKAAHKRKSKTNSVILPTKLTMPNTGKQVKFDDGIKLLEAAARNDLSEVRSMLENGVNPDVANEDGLTALHQCVIDESEDMLLLLLKYNASVNARDSELWTPLHAASTCGYVEICRHLVESGANLLAVNADGNMPYDICDDEPTLEYLETQMADQGVTQTLIDETRLSTETLMLSDMKAYESNGNSLSTWKDRSGASLLHICAANGYFDAAQYLLDKRIDVNATDNDGWTPAMAAVFWVQLSLLDLLAKNGANLDLKNKDNKTLLDMVDNEDTELLDQIKEIKEEAESNLLRFKRANSDIRRKSSNNIRSLAAGNSIYSSNTSLTDKSPFSSSVRRLSMREKQRLSHKDALDEAKGYRISISTDDISDEPSANRSTRPFNAEVEHIPITNIDDIQLSVSDNHVTTITISSADETRRRVDSDGQQAGHPADITNSDQPTQILDDNAVSSVIDNNRSDKLNSMQQHEYANKNAGVHQSSTSPHSVPLSTSVLIGANDDDTNDSLRPSDVRTCGDEQTGLSATNRTTVETYPSVPDTGVVSDHDQLNGSARESALPPNFGNADISNMTADQQFGDPPMKKYTALNQGAVGSDETSTEQKCCVVS